MLKDILAQLHAQAEVCKSTILDELAKNNDNKTLVAKMFHTNFYEVKTVIEENSSMSDQYACECLLYYYEHKGKQAREPADAKIAQDTSPKPWDKLPKIITNNSRVT